MKSIAQLTQHDIESVCERKRQLMTNANGDQLALDIYCNLADVEDCICRIVCEQAKATRKLVKRCLLTNVLMAGLVLAALVSLKLLPS